MPPKGGLFAVLPPPDEDEEADDTFDDMDLEPTEDEADDMGGAFESYAREATDPKASPEARVAALREAILSLLEEQKP